MRKSFFALILAITTFCSVKAQQTIYLHVEQPGTLGEMIGDYKYQISSIKLTGQLNGSDIIVLRDMAGRHLYWQEPDNAYVPGNSDGILQKIDLSGAHIVAGGDFIVVGAYQHESIIENVGCNTENNIISDIMFSELPNLRSIILPNSVTALKEAVFQGDTNLESVTIGENVTELGEYVFDRCESLRELIVKNPTPPTALTEPDFTINVANVFYGFHTDQCQLTIPKGSREAYKESELWKCFFDTRTVIETIFVDDDIPADNVVVCFPGKLDRIIGTRRYNLESIKLSGYMDANDVAVLRDMMGIVVDKDGNITRTDGRLTEIDMSEVKFVTGPDCYYYTTDNGYARYGVIENELLLPSGMFAGCNNLKSVVLPLSIQAIGNDVFHSCSSLGISPIEDYIEHIGGDAFAECTSLREVRLSQNLLTIGDGAFRNCPLDKVIIPDKVQIIGSRAFYSDSDIMELALGNSVEIIGEQAFGKCTNLNDIYVWATVPPTLGKGGKKSEYDGSYDYEGDMTFFQSIDFENCRLVIPAGTYEAYSTAPIWSRFKNIMETTTTGIEAPQIISDDSNASPKEIYDISGRRRTELMPGLNIVRLRNGEVKKIMVGNR